MKIFYELLVIGLDFVVGTRGGAVENFVIFINVLEIDRFDVLVPAVTDPKNIFDAFQGGFLGRMQGAVGGGNLKQEVKKGEIQ